MKTVFIKQTYSDATHSHSHTVTTLPDYLERLNCAKSLAGMTGNGPISFNEIAQFQKAKASGATAEKLEQFFSSCALPKFPDGSPAYQVINFFE